MASHVSFLDNRFAKSLLFAGFVKLWGSNPAGGVAGLGQDRSDLRLGCCWTGREHSGNEYDGIHPAVEAAPDSADCFRVCETGGPRSEEHTSELQSHHDLVCRLLLE